MLSHVLEPLLKLSLILNNCSKSAYIIHVISLVLSTGIKNITPQQFSLLVIFRKKRRNGSDTERGNERGSDVVVKKMKRKSLMMMKNRLKKIVKFWRKKICQSLKNLLQLMMLTHGRK